MSTEKTYTSNWRLKYFFIAFMLNAMCLAVGVFGFGPSGKSTVILFLLWSMAVGVSSTWLAIVHVLRCRAKQWLLWQLPFYFVPGIILYLIVRFVELPIPNI